MSKDYTKIAKVLKPFGLVHISNGLFTHETSSILVDLSSISNPKELIPLVYDLGVSRGRVSLKTELQDLLQIQKDEY